MMVYGEEKWEEIRRQAKIELPAFSTHQVYPDNYFWRLTNKACKILKISEKEYLTAVGCYFVGFIGQYGYDRVLSVLGRQFRDFLNGLDNLHEYLRFSYPRIKAPSFFCDNETRDGLHLHYRTKRKGFIYYTIGQIKEVGRHFYDTEVDVDVISESHEAVDGFHFTMRLKFDNQAFINGECENQWMTNQASSSVVHSAAMKWQQSTWLGKSNSAGGSFGCGGWSQYAAQGNPSYSSSSHIQSPTDMLSVRGDVFLSIFPFCIVFDENLIIKAVGTCLQVCITFCPSCP